MADMTTKQQKNPWIFLRNIACCRILQFHLLRELAHSFRLLIFRGGTIAGGSDKFYLRPYSWKRNDHFLQNGKASYFSVFYHFRNVWSNNFNLYFFLFIYQSWCWKMTLSFNSFLRYVWIKIFCLSLFSGINFVEDNWAP